MIKTAIRKFLRCLYAGFKFILRIWQQEQQWKDGARGFLDQVLLDLSYRGREMNTNSIQARPWEQLSYIFNIQWSMQATNIRDKNLPPNVNFFPTLQNGTGLGAGRGQSILDTLSPVQVFPSRLTSRSFLQDQGDFNLRHKNWGWCWSWWCWWSWCWWSWWW